MSNEAQDGLGLLIMAGPVGAIGLYWLMYRHYRNTHQSHAFERETAIEAKPVTGIDKDRKVGEVKDTQDNRIEGDNVRAYRKRVQRV